ncbi:hypothetical protein C8R44DRAFT_228745 [Mycena epipterygia]|nr:hypothetical protein C8R44DRAFT_228745 [Mycena epipterygia]
MSLPQLGIAELPQDVLLELAKELDVCDLISLLATCHLIRELQLQRSLWIEALVRIKTVQMQPLPLSNADELDTLSLQQLQDTVRRASRLIHSLRSDKPRPVLIRTLPLEALADIFCIPGANLVVSHTRGTVSMWDITTSHRVAQLDIPGLSVQPQALCLDIKGKALIGAYVSSISSRIGKLVAICIDYRDRAHISISHVISPDVISPDINRQAFNPALFINPKVMGACIGWLTQAGRCKFIASWSMQVDAVVHHTSEDSHLSFQGSLYLFELDLPTGNATVQRLRLLNQKISTTSIAPSTPDITTLHCPHTLIVGSWVMPNPHLFRPDYGIFAVTSKYWATPHQKTRIYFWRAHVDHDGLTFGQAWFYEHPERIQGLVVGVSVRPHYHTRRFGNWTSETCQWPRTFASPSMTL